MKLFKQFLTIISFTYLGEIIAKVGHIPIPGSVLGMLLLFLALNLKLVKVESIETVGTFLLDNLSVFFVPAGVGIMVYYPLIKDQWASLLLLTFGGTLFILGLIGFVVQFVQRRFERGTLGTNVEEETSHVTRIDE